MPGDWRMHHQYRRLADEDVDYALGNIHLGEMQQYDSRLATLQEENQRLSQRLNRVEMQIETLLRNQSYPKHYYNDYPDPSDPMGYMKSIRERERKMILQEQGRWDSSLRYPKYPYDEPMLDGYGMGGRRRLSVLDKDGVKASPNNTKIPRHNRQRQKHQDSDKGSDADSPK